MPGQSFYDVLTEAMQEFSEHGYQSPETLAYWQERLRRAAEQSATTDAQLREMLVRAYRDIYAKLVDREDILRFHQGVGRFTLEKIRPELRAELERRILASADLIKIHRSEAIQKTLQRFSGWATSIPKGGSETVEKRETKKEVRKSLASLPFIERRVLIDQGHKLTANIDAIVAKSGNALAARWFSHWKQANYNYRKDHKNRDGKIYAVRGNWALEKGLMKAGPNGYTDQITEPAQEPFCRCRYIYLYNLRQLPADMLTKKGAEQLAAVRVAA